MVTAAAPAPTTELIQVDNYAVAYSARTGIAYTTNAHAGRAGGAAGQAAPVSSTTAPVNQYTEDGALNNKVAMWGLANDLPTQIVADVEANPELASTLNYSANALIAGGLVYGYVETDPETGKEKMRVVSDPEVDEWLENTNIDLYLRQISKDFFVLNHGFTEFILNEAGNFCAGLACQDTSFCRFGLQDEKGRVKWGYISTDWKLVSDVEDTSKVIKLPLLDPHFGVQTQLEFGNQRRYLYPTSGNATGRVYYQPAPWHSLRTSGWLELANAIPRFKLALLKNQFTIKYHVQIPDWWWRLKYADWEEQPTLKAQRVQAELDAFNAKMAGVDNAGNSILTMLKTDDQGKAFDGWKITAIDDKLQDGKYIEDSQEACSHIFFAVGVDPTLIGAAPGKGQGAGSGSDKRVAQNIWVLNSASIQNIMLEPIKAAFLFNKFGAKNGKRRYDLWFRSYLVSTLDTGSPAGGKKPGTNKNNVPA